MNWLRRLFGLHVHKWEMVPPVYDEYHKTLEGWEVWSDSRPYNLQCKCGTKGCSTTGGPVVYKEAK